jgi:pimeloyl-ACP methyl ester carboxylesterase
MNTLTIATLAFAAIGMVTQASAQTSQGHYADVNGIHLYYEIHGSASSNGAPPLVLLHGGLMSSSLWGPTLPALAAGREVIAVDLQAHGHTTDIDRPISVQAMGDDIAALLQYLKIPHADIMGYSLGGGAALQVAVRHPELVRKLVLVSTPIRRTDFYPDILKQQAMVNAAMAEQMKQTLMYQTYAKENPRPQDWPRLLQKVGDFMKTDYDFSDEVRALKLPTLIVAGDADIFPVKYAVRTFELLGGSQKDGGWDGSGRIASQIAILPGVTHYVMGVAPALAPTAIAFLDAPATTIQASK